MPNDKCQICGATKGVATSYASTMPHFNSIQEVRNWFVSRPPIHRCAQCLWNDAMWRKLMRAPWRTAS